MAEIDEGLETILACVLGENESAVYFATPITSGPRYIHWYRSEGHAIEDDDVYRQRHEANVIAYNVGKAAQGVEQVRLRCDGIVINPAVVQISGWTQGQYNRFWATVIDRFVSKIIFNDGWPFSSGCRMEYKLGTKLGIPLQDLRGDEIDSRSADKVIKEAIAEIEGLGLFRGRK